jgi:hypothetical protein
MKKIIIKECSEDSRIIFEYLKSKKKLTPINSPTWIEILHQTYRVNKVYFVAYDNGSACGILSGYVIKSLKFKNILHTLKDGLVADSDLIYSKLLNYADSFCQKNTIHSFLISTGEYQLKRECYKVIVKKFLKIEVPKTEDECWNSFSKNRRKNLKKILRQDFYVDNDKGNLKSFYKIYANSMTEKNVPIHSFNFFKKLFYHFDELAELITLKKNDIVIGGIVLIRSKDYVYCSYQSSDKFFAKYELNNLLIWESIKRCISLKITCLHMGEASIGGGVYNFKIRVGAEPCNSYYYTNKASSLANYKDDEKNGGKKSPDNIKSFFVKNLPMFLLRPLFIFLKKRSKML